MTPTLGVGATYGATSPPPALAAPIELSEQTVDAVVRRLTADLATRITDGLAEQIAAHVAERVMQNAFGDSLRQTVHDVSERLVREEIARIRAAASTDSPHPDS